VLYVRIIVGVAFLLMATFGPGVGFRRITNPNLDPLAAAKRHLDHRRAAVLILRILAAMVGFWLLFFSIVQLLHGHGQLPH
jgi:hypothetical protein